MAGKVGLYIKYEPMASRTSKSEYQRISSFRFEGNITDTKAHDKEAPDGKAFVLNCSRCGSNDWTDNGRNINEYECRPCGHFVEAYHFKTQD